jgi:hypothetical protein
VGSRRTIAVLAAALVTGGLAGCSGGGEDVAAGCVPAGSSSLVALRDPKGLVKTDG